MKKSKLKLIVAISIIAVLLVNLVLFGMQKIDVLWFWAIILVGFLVSHFYFKS